MGDLVPFQEESFLEYMNTVVRDWLRESVEERMLTSFDGKRICYFRALNPDAKAVIVMLHGFCGFFGKFHEVAYDFYQSGYSVYFLEQRGHGGSGRSVEEPDLVDVGDFSEYVEDLKCLMDKVVVPENSSLLRRAAARGADGMMSGRGRGVLPLFLFGHSMGGCVSTLFLEKYPGYFRAAVLSSPMLKLGTYGIPGWVTSGNIAIAKLLRRGFHPFPGGKPFDGTPDLEGSGSVSEVRYNYQFALRIDPAAGSRNTMNRGTNRWLWAARSATDRARRMEALIKIPLLVCQAGNDAYVDNDGLREIAQNAPDAKLRVFPEAKHEIFASDPETLEKYYREVLGFFAEQERKV